MSSLNIEILAKSKTAYLDYEKIQLLKSVVLYTGAKIVVISAEGRLLSYPLVEEQLVGFG